MRRISRYQGAMTRSRLNRAVIARYFAFMIISNMIIFSLLGVVYSKYHVIFVCHARSALTSAGHQTRSLRSLSRSASTSQLRRFSVIWAVSPPHGFVMRLENPLIWITSLFRNPQRSVLKGSPSMYLKSDSANHSFIDIQGTYVQQSTYWLTVFPLRGFLVIFEIVQLIKLLLLSVQRL